MEEPLRIAVLGNSFAARVQLPALKWAGGNRVVAIAGRDGARARDTARRWNIPFATDAWQAVFDADRVGPLDLVLVTTPVALHHPMVLAALETPAAVLCEKPFTLDVAQARELTERAAGRAAWIDHELRWSPHLRTLRRSLQSGALGSPLHAAIEMFLPPAKDRGAPWGWWYDASRGGGILGALGSHLIDLLLWLFGEPRSVRATLATLVPERPDAQGHLRAVTADDHAALELGFQDGFTASCVTSLRLPSERFFHLQVTGRARTARLVGGDELALGPTLGQLEHVAVEHPLPSCAEMGLPEYGLFGRALPPFLRDVVRTLAAGRAELPMAATFADGLATQRVLDAARRSAATHGGWVDCARVAP